MNYSESEGLNVTEREKIIVSAYTGFLMCDFKKVHQYAQELLGRQIYTHEMKDADIQAEIHEKSMIDFLKICQEETKNINTNDLISRSKLISHIKARIKRYGDRYTIGHILSYLEAKPPEKTTCGDVETQRVETVADLGIDRQDFKTIKGVRREND